MSEDVRASALLDQLTEIDQREVTARKWRTTWRQRVWNLGLIGTLVLIMEWSGVDALAPAVLLVALQFSSEPIVRLFLIRRLDRERERLLTLYDEIDRAAELGKGGSNSDAV